MRQGIIAAFLLLSLALSAVAEIKLPGIISERVSIIAAADMSPR